MCSSAYYQVILMLQILWDIWYGTLDLVSTKTWLRHLLSFFLVTKILVTNRWIDFKLGVLYLYDAFGCSPVSTFHTSWGTPIMMSATSCLFYYTSSKQHLKMNLQEKICMSMSVTCLISTTTPELVSWFDEIL